MMLRSAEVRWIIPGALPDEALSWFSAGQAVDSWGVQAHEYLVFPDCRSVGVKMREGRFEIKAMLDVPQPLSLGTGIQGTAEEWVKWSFASGGLQIIGPELRRAGFWLKVHKERFLRTFSADEGNLVQVTARLGSEQRSLLRAGCNMELTRIEAEVNPRFWFSLGFEAFGPSPLASRSLLLETVHFFFHRYGGMPGISLDERNSLSYPAWLAKVAKTLEGDDGNSSSSES
jgi:hypothetical protein